MNNIYKISLDKDEYKININETDNNIFQIEAISKEKTLIFNPEGNTVMIYFNNYNKGYYTRLTQTDFNQIVDLIKTLYNNKSKINNDDWEIIFSQATLNDIEKCNKLKNLINF